VTVLFGWSESVLHLFFFLPCLAAVMGMYFLAGYFCGRPLAAVLFSLLTPVFLVHSTNLMTDVTMLAFWVWSLVFWMRGLVERWSRWFWVVGVLVSLCILTKYTGILLLPLLLASGAVHQRKAGRWLLAFLAG
jgi:4-amino-4-deoxy-L-arabinose transferase-like glycosyltransferase